MHSKIISEPRCNPRFDSGSERDNVRTTLFDLRFDSGSERVTCQNNVVAQGLTLGVKGLT